MGYCFQIDLARRAVQAGLTVAEVPITFLERAHGTSKMSKAIVCEALWLVTSGESPDGSAAAYPGRAGAQRRGRPEPGASIPFHALLITAPVIYGCVSAAASGELQAVRG